MISLKLPAFSIEEHADCLLSVRIEAESNSVTLGFSSSNISENQQHSYSEINVTIPIPALEILSDALVLELKSNELEKVCNIVNERC